MRGEIGFSLFVKVSPVITDESFATAPISPGASSEAASWSFPLTTKICATLSVSPLVTFNTWESLLKVPLYIRKYDSLPTKGSAEVSKTNPYLNEPVSIVYKLYVSQDTGVNNWRELDAPRYADFWSKNINIKNLTVENGTYKGEPYRYVILRKTVLYPQKIGELSIEPLVLDITVQTPSNRRDFFGQILNNTINKTVSAGKLKINVKPLPDTGKPNNFSGAVGKFDLLVTTSKKELLLSEAFQLNLEIKGNGNFNLFSFPSINLPQSLEVYEPERLEKLITNFKGIRGSIKDQYTVVPSSPGKYSIPKISFNYFDPNDSKYKTQTSAVNYINVKGAIINNVRKENNIDNRNSNKLGLVEYGNLSFKKKTKFQKINQEIFFSEKHLL